MMKLGQNHLALLGIILSCSIIQQEILGEMAARLTYTILNSIFKYKMV